jgi:hypothetical protein
VPIFCPGKVNILKIFFRKPYEKGCFERFLVLKCKKLIVDHYVVKISDSFSVCLGEFSLFFVIFAYFDNFWAFG